MKHFIFEKKDYEINPEYKIPQKKYVLIAGLASLYILSKKKSGGSSYKQSLDKRQKCIAKMYYSYSLSAHKEQINRYLQREGTGKDGTTAELYGTDENEYRNNMVSKNFRIFLSPENDKISLEALSKTFINRLELQTGYKFYWIAAEHYNTAHPHVHLLINGIDKNRQEVFLPPDIVKKYIRDIARDICTSLIGSRTDEQIRMEKEKQFEATRFTKIDNLILSKIKDNILNSKNIKGNNIIKKRLDHLIKLNLCKYKDNKYFFESKWEQNLKNVGRYNTYLEAREKLKFTTKFNFELFENKHKEKSGVITKIYRLQEDSDSHAIIMESIDGNAYFIPLFYKPKDIKEGDLLSVRMEQNQKGRLTPLMQKESFNNLIYKCNYYGFTKGFAAELLKTDNVYTFDN